MLVHHLNSIPRSYPDPHSLLKSSPVHRREADQRQSSIDFGPKAIQVSGSLIQYPKSLSSVEYPERSSHLNPSPPTEGPTTKKNQHQHWSRAPQASKSSSTEGRPTSEREQHRYRSEALPGSSSTFEIRSARPRHSNLILKSSTTKKMPVPAKQAKNASYGRTK